ncbi:hypothetical protein CORC01_01464 [Colletotrichum orchidophilum]|uniref:Uncharacterized protein n=1 Tax=Colletotrichum orchidophilum TaxID=1209926 RepID=A0A1G4BNQ1_9PEZI|nr:uncharacterized protein CORC01_01464 [Colletotrichum orchidophilum]OHF03080.1 hypothetical protein CORC01_01464 [Colletotrichum orchidophilum]
MPAGIDTPGKVRPNVEAIRSLTVDALKAFKSPFPVTDANPGMDESSITKSLENLRSLWDGGQTNSYWASLWIVVSNIIDGSTYSSFAEAEEALKGVMHSYARQRPGRILSYRLTSFIITKISRTLSSWKNAHSLTSVQFFYLLAFFSNRVKEIKTAWHAIDDNEWSRLVILSCKDAAFYIARHSIAFQSDITCMDRLILYHVVPESEEIIGHLIPMVTRFMEQIGLRQEELPAEYFGLDVVPAPISTKDLLQASRRLIGMTDPYHIRVLSASIFRWFIRERILADPDPVAILRQAQVMVQNLCNKLNHEDDLLSQSV